jgi:hypothetical protein
MLSLKRMGHDRIKKREARRERGYRSNLIGERGQKAAETLFLEWDWLPRSANTLDQGVDFRVEIGLKGQGQGYHFLVSAKGYDGKGKIGTVAIRRASANYVARQRDPVFLTYAHLRAQIIYWVDLKALCLAQSTGPVRVTFDVAQCMHLGADEATVEGERERFLAALEESAGDWHIRRLGDVPGALAKSEADLTRIDPRFKVRLLAGSHGVTCEVSAPEPVEMQVHVTVSDADEREKLREAIDYGLPRKVSVSSFDLVGSPLIDKLMSKSAQGTIAISGHAIANVQVFVSAVADGPRFALAGSITKGQKGGSLVASSEANPIRMQIVLDDDKQRTSLNMDTAVERWRGRHLLPMTGLLETAVVLESIATKGVMRVEFRTVTGSAVDLQTLSDDRRELMAQVGANLRILADLREVALLYSKDIVLGGIAEWVIEDMLWWRTAKRLLDGGQPEIALRRLEMTMHVEAGAEELVTSEVGDFVLAPMPMSVSAFGQEVCNIPVDAYAKGYALKTSWLDSGDALIELTRLPNSILRLRRSSTAGFDGLVSPN